MNITTTSSTEKGVSNKILFEKIIEPNIFIYN